MQCMQWCCNCTGQCSTNEALTKLKCWDCSCLDVLRKGSSDAPLILAVLMLQLHWAQQGNMGREAGCALEEQPMESLGDTGTVSSV